MHRGRARFPNFGICAKWEPEHQRAPTLDPRAEFAVVLREIGAAVQGEHPIMNGKPHWIPATNDKPGERTIFYVAHSDGVASGYAENNRTKQIIRWKGTGQHLSQGAKAELLAQSAQKRYARRRVVFCAQSFGQKALSRRCIAFGRSQEVDRHTVGVHRAI